MTSQTLTPLSSGVLPTSPEGFQAGISAATSRRSPHSLSPQPLIYQLDHQAEFLRLQAETESLLQQLQTLKQERLSSVA